MSKKSFKILAIVPSGFCFGLQHVTVDFFSKFPSNVQSHFLLTKWNNGEMSTLLDKYSIPYSFSWLGMFSRKLDWFNLKMSLHALIMLPRLYFDFLRIKKKFKPDILFFANHHELILLLPVLLITKTKVVCHMHDPAPSISFQKITFWFYNKVVNKFIAISDSVRQRTIALGCNPDKVTTVHNGIKIVDDCFETRGRFFLDKANWESDCFILGLTGQMSEHKGHEDLLTALSIVIKSNNKVRLVIGGKVIEPFYSKLCSMLRSLAISEYVFFSGWMEDVNDFFKNIDVFLLASRHDEGYGLVVAQAMVNGLPVIITNSGGAVEIVEDGVSGFIVPKKDVNKLADAILLLSSDELRCKNIGANARKRIELYFDLERQSKILLTELMNVDVR